ncbi:BQ2448_2453 [Microbotryum intermedium]|uniref:tRNA-specific adenosine deaminase 1 n=1 Tax=Microbotryum intermedium TaxID=269621 RepID=A0A238FBP6_9BASI|nr:BQ2448_2453 [Microbotryum intermedium]
MNALPLPLSVTENIARAVLDTYHALPPKGKPRTRTNGAREWTVLAGFCLYPSSERERYDLSQYRCVSIGTGVRVLPYNKLPRHGDVIHDSHGEIIARRGLLRYLVAQLEAAIGDEDPASSCLVRGSNGRWKLKDELRLGMYVSTLPCGDASTYSLALLAPPSPPLEPIAAPQHLSKPPPMLESSIFAASLGIETSRNTSMGESAIPQVRRGRVGYSAPPGTLRTKPGRLDSPPTTSHSCSDKLAMWSLVGVQGGTLAALGVDRIIVSTLVVGGVPKDEQERVEAEVTRAVGGRLGDWIMDGCRSTVPYVGFCDAVFEKDRSAIEGPGEVVSAAESEFCSAILVPTTLPLSNLSYLVPSNADFSYILDEGIEIVCNGTRMGGKLKRNPGEPLSRKTSSRISQLKLMQRCAEVAPMLGLVWPSSQTYHQSKCSSLASWYQYVKHAVRSPGAPLEAWLVTGAEYESFDCLGRLEPSPTKEEAADVVL